MVVLVLFVRALLLTLSLSSDEGGGVGDFGGGGGGVGSLGGGVGSRGSGGMISDQCREIYILHNAKSLGANLHNLNNAKDSLYTYIRMYKRSKYSGPSLIRTSSIWP